MIKTGSWLIAISFITVPVYGALKLKAVTTDGAPVYEISAGVPFVLELSGDSLSGDVTPVLHNIKPAQILEQGIRRSFSFAGTSQSVDQRVVYTVRIDTPGEFKLGPAEVTLQGITTSSNTVTVTVTAGSSSFSNAKNNTGLLVLEAGTTSAVVGQEIPITLRLLSPTPLAQVQEVKAPVIVDGEIKQWQGPMQSTQVKHNQRYFVYEWRGFLYPKKAGKLVIPAIKIDYVLAGDNFFGLMWPLAEVQTEYSNALTLTIQALPESSELVNGVGQFTDFTAAIDKRVAEQTALLMLTLEGTQGLEQVVDLPLQLPAGLKYYTSQVKSEQNKKQFEYVIQALQAGEYVIPAQQFVYFDTRLQSYRKLLTKPLQVRFTKGSQQQVQDKQQIAVVDTKKELADHFRSAPLVFLDCASFTATVPVYPVIPWWLFITGMLLPILWYLSVASIFSKINSFFKKKEGSFEWARQQIEKARQEQNVAILPAIFSKVFKQLDPHTQSIDGVLQNKGFSAQQREAWHEFFNTVLAFSYAPQKPVNIQQVFTDAQQWITIFEKHD